MPSPSPPWKRWYKTARWQELRLRVFARDKGVCQCGCGGVGLSRVEADALAILLAQGSIEAARSIVAGKPIVADHKDPHRGDERKFWDETKVQTLLKPCHDRVKQKEEQATLNQRGVWH